MIAALLNPYVILAALLALLGSFGYGHHVGWDSRDKEMQIEVAKLNEQSRTKEQQLTNQINNQAFALRKATDEISKKQSDMSRLALAGRLRLPSSCPQTPANSSAAAGDRNEAAGELERQTVEALIAIAADGDRAATQANACIDAYNEVRRQLNGDS